ncbi:hypothetical protein KR009_005589 [Drosophila setifemur]|nr:hypothetical protein KR009_005589 [Drosophila setifemur]
MPLIDFCLTRSFLCRKSRNLSEKKRRDQFNSLVNDLSALISTSSRKMDKSTVLKSTIAFLKNHNEAADRSKVFEIQQDWKPTFLSNDEFTHLMLESLDGFMMVFSSMGSIFYASESITSQLGYLPHELYNKTIYDLAYEMDHEALLNIFMNPTPVIEPRQTDIGASNQITFYTHLKRGGLEKVDSSSYELVKFVGYFRNDANTNTGSSSDSQSGGYSGNGQPAVLPRIFQQNPNVEVDKKLVFVGTGRVQNPQLIREMSIIDPTSNEFTSKHSMEWKFLFLDHRAPPIIGYMPFEVLGTSGYDYYHFDDLDSIVACHEELRQNGEGKSCYYRFLTKGQQWIWLQTDYYVSYNQFNSKPDYVVCTHKVISYAEVLKDSQKERQKAAESSNNNDSSQAIPSTENSSKSASATTTLRDFEMDNQNLDSTLLGNSLANLGTETAATSPTIDSSPMWSASVAQASGSCQINPLKTSRPASSYGNISSTGISPKAKRKCYYYSRGNESDSTSISADSVTSRQSMMTHGSSQSQRQRSHHRDHHHSQHHHQQQQQQLQSQQHQQQLQHQQVQQRLQQNVGPPKMVPILPIAPGPIIANNPCQFPQQAYPLASSHLMAPTFLEPPQYLTAIPMQPVIAPFPVAPVLSPLPVPVSLPVTGQSDLLPGAVVMTPTQSQLQDQLQRKHDELQKLIMQQQDELRIVSEQLLLARYTYLQPMMQMGFATGNMAGNAVGSLGAGGQRGLNFTTSNAVQPQFNQYGFALNSEQMLNQQDQQMMMQQQQNLHTQQQHNLQQQHHSQSQLQQNLHNQQQHQQQQHQQQQQLQLQMQQQNDILTREDMDDIDAFLNLSPLQSLGSQSTLNQLNTGSNNNNNQHFNGSSNQNGHQNNNNGNSNVPQNTNEDSLLSYMQMATESSPSLNFHMGISDDGSETHSEDNKRMHSSSGNQMQQQQQQQQHQQQQQQIMQQQHQQQSNNFFSSNPFLNNSQNQNQLPNDLEILPYQMSQEQSQNLFNSPHTAPGSSQ